MEKKRNIEITSLAKYEVAKETMHQRPSKRAQHSINFRSFSLHETLKVIVVSDIYGIMGRARRFIENKILMDNVKAQDDQILKEVNQFQKQFIPIFDEGFPPFGDKRKVMISKGIYDVNLTHEKMNHQSFQDMEKSLKGEIVVAKLRNEFNILSQLHKVKSQLPPTNLAESHNLEILAREMKAYEITNNLQWEETENFSKFNYSSP